MRISDWSSDVCSSDLFAARAATMIPQFVRSHDEIAALRERIETLVCRDDLLPITDPVREVGTVPFGLAYHGVHERALLERPCGFQLCTASRRGRGCLYSEVSLVTVIFNKKIQAPCTTNSRQTQ